MASAELNIAKFREQYPEFADADAYPDNWITLWWEAVGGYIDLQENYRVKLTTVQQASYMLLAHLLFLAGPTGSAGYGGAAGGIETSASIDSVSVSVQAPPSGSSQYRFWLNQSRYGQLFLALMGRVMAGGFYVGGSLDRAAFRRM